MSYDVFISYNSADERQALWVKENLEANSLSCWMAPMCISGGSSYAAEIPKAIAECTYFVLILSQMAQQSKWVSREVDRAINEDKIVLPFVIEDCPLTPEYQFYLANVQYYYAYQDRVTALQKLIADIRSVRGHFDQSAVVIAPSTKSPSGSVQLLLDDGVLYEGEAFAGVPHGFGKAQYADGSCYEGEWNRGVRSGQGKTIFKTGEEWVGEYKDGQAWTGRGVVYTTVKSGYALRYEGEYRDGKRNGYGKMQYSDSIYEGQWVDGKRNGPGKLVWNAGGEWVGEYKDDQAWTGQGVMYTTGESGYVFRYDGEYRDGKRNGYGKMQYSDSIYEGQWVDGKRNGPGKLVWNAGGEWVGEYKDDQAWTGQGTWYTTGKDGYLQRYDGEYRDGKRNGYGKMQYCDSIYEGQWVDARRNGRGKIIWNAGGEWIGEYRDSQPWTGQGVMYTIRDGYAFRYEGEYRDGQRTGRGIVYWEGGEQWSGVFKNGLPWNGQGVWYYASGKCVGRFAFGKCLDGLW